MLIKPRFACVLAACLLAACRQPPAITPTPTRTPSPNAEEATPTKSLSPIEPVILGAEVRAFSWSPDSRWLAYLYNETFDPTLEASGRVRVAALHFYDATSGQICSHPEFETTEFEMPLIWQADGSVLIGLDGAAYEGMPCATTFALSTQPAPQPSFSMPSKISRQGTYSIQVDDISADTDLYHYNITFLETATGEPIMTHEFVRHMAQTLAGIIAGTWLTDTLFLTEDVDSTEGHSILIDVSQQTTTDVETDLLQLDPTANNGSRYYPYVILGRSPDSYHLIFHDSNYVSAPDILLYHPETGTVETLPFQHLWLYGTSSPDGNWLLLERRVPSDEVTSEVIEMWARLVDPIGTEAQFIARGTYSIWNDDWTHFALKDNNDDSRTLVYEFPSGEFMTEWSSPGYATNPWLWSPDGRRLVINGSREGDFSKAMMFVVEVKP